MSQNTRHLAACTILFCGPHKEQNRELAAVLCQVRPMIGGFSAIVPFMSDILCLDK